MIVKVLVVMRVWRAIVDNEGRIENGSKETLRKQ